LEEEFTVRVMGSAPVEGPTTTTGLAVVQTMYAYDGWGLEPSVVDGPVYFQLSEAAPYGAEVGRCQTKYCAGEDEEAQLEILEIGVDYDAYEGWYFARATSESYRDDGELQDDLGAWLMSLFCAVHPDCTDPSIPQIVAM
jgi:hypothetical protein